MSPFFVLLVILQLRLFSCRPIQHDAYYANLSSLSKVADVDCGISNKIRSAKIVNGEETVEGEFPWMVSLVGLRGEHICGGVLIHKRWILTAAHCISKKEATQIQISVAWDRSAIIESNVVPRQAQVYRINRIVAHPSFDPSRSKVTNDIALIQLSDEATWSDFVQPICLPDTNQESLAGVMATVTGWGMTKSGGRNAMKLRKVDVPIVPNEQCKQWLKEGKKALVVTENSICAGYEEGKKDSCNGDSGGPLMIKNDKGRQVVVAVVSGGIGCALPRLPGIYTRVNSYLGWISSTVRQ